MSPKDMTFDQIRYHKVLFPKNYPPKSMFIYDLKHDTLKSIFCPKKGSKTNFQLKSSIVYMFAIYPTDALGGKGLDGS